jgi:hypothetical protein
LRDPPHSGHSVHVPERVEADAAELTEEHLDVYDTRDGPWNPEHGELTIPQEWEFLPRGDAFLTRSVKAAGVYWVSWQPRGRNRPHRRALGLWAPAEAIEAARERAQATEQNRTASRTSGADYRARQEARYRAELRAEVLKFLAFTTEHQALADDIATATAEYAAIVGSGRVGRARILPIDERAALAARAYIRHVYTDYDRRLDHLPPERWDADFLYRDIKHQAHDAVDQFLEDHRPKPCDASGQSESH